jgi:alkanesulfonate monooxygenase SsuD/methylene tetrahydromethanopterin reductase-like flavin-dependent oxidoreductase (luciferase family)
MDYGVFLPVSGAAATRAGLKHAAETAERLGFTTVWAADRIIIPWKIETDYAYSWSGAFIVPPEKPFLESMTALAFLAGATESIRLGVSVLVTPYRDPVYWAKVAATIDTLSEGRFVLGVGIGWMREEFDALGRGELFESRGAQRRAGLYGDAWFPYFARVTPSELARRYENVRAHADGRDVALNCCLSVEVTDEPLTSVEPDRLAGTPEQIAEALERFKDVGAQHVALQFLVGRYPERLAQMERLMPVLLS